MKQITREMLRIYKPLSNMDWMNYKLVKKDLTFHHIVKAELGGKRVVSNGALLMPVALVHRYLHLIECKDIETYEHINEIFKIVNRQEYEPTRDQREIIEYLLQDFEYKHRNDKNSKGKTLIKREYKKRFFIDSTE